MQVKVHSFEKAMLTDNFSVEDFARTVISEKEEVQVLVTDMLEEEMLNNFKKVFIAEKSVFCITTYTQMLKTQFDKIEISKDKKNIVLCQCLLSGSTQHSCAVLAQKLKSKKVIFWNNEGLLHVADTNYVPLAPVINQLSFEEANELSYFGSPIINSVALVPLQKGKISVEYRYLKQMQRSGTLICSKEEEQDKKIVKGFSAIHEIALLSVEGPCMSGVPGISAQLFTALKDADISVILISQASSECSICFAVKEQEAFKAYEAVKGVFGKKFQNLIEVNIQKKCCVLAAVGSNMIGSVGVSGLIFSALGNAGVNIKAIAQGSNERNLSVVLSEEEVGLALRSLVTAFENKQKENMNSFKREINEGLTLALFGPGQIGSELLSRVKEFNKNNRKKIKVALIANSKKCLYNKQGINLDTWREEFTLKGENLSLEEIQSKINDLREYEKIALIDCTASTVIPKIYPKMFASKINIITANKIGLCCPLDEYKNMFNLCEENDCYFGYEATVGAGLPLIHALWDLKNSGEKIVKIEGIFSGTLAWLFNEYDGVKSFGELVLSAKKMGYTEPDPRIDLAGLDVARKVVILSRLMGLEKGLEDFSSDVLFNQELAKVDLKEFLDRISELDEPLKKKLDEAKSQEKVLRYVGMVDKNGVLSAGLKSFDKNSPFALSSGTDNLVVIYTEEYKDSGLSIKGKGAGAGVTVSGLMSDISRIL